MKKVIENKEQDTLDLQDLLVDDQENLLSDYLSVSIEKVDEGTKVSVTTVDDNPITYTATLTPENLGDLQFLIDDGGDMFSE